MSGANYAPPLIFPHQRMIGVELARAGAGHELSRISAQWTGNLSI